MHLSLLPHEDDALVPEEPQLELEEDELKLFVVVTFFFHASSKVEEEDDVPEEVSLEMFFQVLVIPDILSA